MAKLARHLALMLETVGSNPPKYLNFILFFCLHFFFLWKNLVLEGLIGINPFNGKHL